MSGDRRPEEVAVVVRRPGDDGDEYLVLLRSPEKLGYWHLVAGGVAWRSSRWTTGWKRPCRATQTRRKP